MQIIEDKYLDLKQLSQYSTLSDSTLRDYLSDLDNPIPYFRVKRKILVRKTEFDAWMEKFRVDDNELDRIVDEVLSDL